MKLTMLKRTLSLLVCIVLIAAVALFTIGCEDNKETSSADESSTVPSKSESGTTASETPETSGDNVLGEGENHFTFKVIDLDGNESVFEIRTDKEKVGEALVEHELISGEEGPYGLYVKTVNGITVDYDKDGKYWAFYVNGKLAPTGVDMTEIENGTTYMFKAE